MVRLKKDRYGRKVFGDFSSWGATSLRSGVLSDRRRRAGTRGAVGKVPPCPTTRLERTIGNVSR